MRDRLIELIWEVPFVCDGNEPFMRGVAGEIADHLLANGVIVPPVSIVGQTVYIPWAYGGTKGVAFFEVTHIITDNNKSYIRTNFETDDEGFWEMYNGGQFDFEDFGKTVFLTREEAEKALAERDTQCACATASTRPCAASRHI